LLQVAGELGGELAVGQVVLGAVRSVAADGAVVLELLGRTVAAVTDLPLGAGTTYELEVVACAPRLVLTPTAVLPLPPLAEALRGGWLGPAAEPLARLLPDRLGCGADLEPLLRALGALGDRPELAALAAENARRAKASAPRVVPLPVETGGWLRAARLFAHAPAARAADSPWMALALLLELRRSGPLRVDVELGRDGVHLRFTAERPETLAALRSAAADLERALGEAGLAVRGSAFRRAGRAGIPVADLLALPAGREGEATVDVRV
jgi:hypothetical protein